MRVIEATPYLSKNTPFNTTCPACESLLEVTPNDIFVDTLRTENGEELSPKYTCPVCMAMVTMLSPAIPIRVLQIWRSQQPV